MTLRTICKGRFRAALAACVLLSGTADAQFTWNNPAGGNWSVAGNWLGGVPVSGATTLLTFGSAPTLAATYTATNDIGGAGTPFNLNAISFLNTSGTVTLAGNPLNFTGAAPTVTIASAGNLVVSAPVNLGANLTIAGAGTGGFTIGGAIAGGANNIVKTSTGTLTLSGGGTLNQLSIQRGNLFITGGTLALTIPTGVGNVDAGLQLATAGGQVVSATVSGGAVVNVVDNTYIADFAGSTATLTVTGTGTVYNNPGSAAALGRFGVGNSGNGTLNVLNGGVVNANQLFAARLAGSTGTVLVDGTGSLLRGITQLSFGSGGAGSMTVQNGGSASSDGSINIGRAVGAGISGVVTVTGTGSTITTGSATGGGSITVGVLGLGTLNVQNGATVTTGNPAFGGQLVVGSGANTGGTVGTLNITTGGKVFVAGPAAAGNFFSATVGPTTATITVNGIGSQLNVNNQFSLSGGGGVDAGPVTLNVLAGGQILVGATTIFGQNAGGSATATVGGTGSSIASAQFQMNSGSNSLTVQSGASVTNTGAALIGFVVTNAATFVGNVTSAVTVTGANSVFSTGTVISLGGLNGIAGSGTAALSVDGGGLITATGGLIMFGSGTANVNAGGSLSVGGVTDGVAAGPFGTINVATGRTLAITDGLTGTYTGLVAGAGSVTKTGTGTQTFAGANTYAGGTTINGGTLSATNTTGSATGSGAIAINSGGTLIGTGSALGAVAINAGGRITGGLGTAVNQTLTASSAVFSGTAILRVVVAEGGGPGDTGLTGASRIALTGTLDTTAGLAQGTDGRLSIELVASGTLVDGVQYQRTIGTHASLGPVLMSIPGAINITPTDPQLAINPIGFQINQTNWVLSITATSMVLTFTPVPEPASLLLIAGAGGLFVRRLRNRRNA